MNPRFAPFSKASHDIRFTADHSSEKNIRRFLIPLGIAFLFLAGFMRLFHLTIVKGSYYKYVAEDNRIKELHIEGIRGTIYDRKNRIIAESTKTDEKENIYQRTYFNGSALAHVIGYRQTASEDQLKHDACAQPLEVNDKVGIKGIEAIFECHLRPIKGKKLVETDAYGKPIRTISQVEPHSGNDIKLSIDAEMQQKAYDIIEANAITSTKEVDLPSKKISIVALEPKTGEVLMLLSYPTFNSQDFEDRTRKVAEYVKSEDKPLFNRATLGTYPPGSVFKPVVALGALQENVIDKDDTVQDNGFIKAGPLTFHNWFYLQYGKTDGAVDMKKSLQRSNDIYYYTIGEKLSPEKMKKWAGLFGFGKRTGIEMDEASGSIPSPFWKREVLKEGWFTGDTYNFSIGQGYLLVTPLQIARASAVVANGGKLCKPTILKSGADENAEIAKDDGRCIDMKIDKEHLQIVKEGMKAACESGGTGWPFFDFRVKDDSAVVGEDVDKESTESAQIAGTRRIEVGCKTGTAESQSKDHMPHAWFTIFAPYEKPEIVLTVMVENSGEGSNVAAPIAKEVLKEYFSRTE